MMLKALLLVHFWSILLLEEQMLTSVRKTLPVRVAVNTGIQIASYPKENE